MIPQVADDCAVDEVRDAAVTVTANDHHFRTELVDHIRQSGDRVATAYLPVGIHTRLFHLLSQLLQMLAILHCFQVFRFLADSNASASITQSVNAPDQKRRALGGRGLLLRGFRRVGGLFRLGLALPRGRIGALLRFLGARPILGELLLRLAIAALLRLLFGLARLLQRDARFVGILLRLLRRFGLALRLFRWQ